MEIFEVGRVEISISSENLDIFGDIWRRFENCLPTCDTRNFSGFQGHYGLFFEHFFLFKECTDWVRLNAWNGSKNFKIKQFLKISWLDKEVLGPFGEC